LRIALTYSIEDRIRMYMIAVVTQGEGVRVLVIQLDRQYAGQHPKTLLQLGLLELWQNGVEKYQQIRCRHGSTLNCHLSIHLQRLALICVKKNALGATKGPVIPAASDLSEIDSHDCSLLRLRAVPVKDMYWTLGSYDIVVIMDAPNEETAMALLLATGSMGNIRTQTLKVFSADEMKSILAKMS
jgi:hypothetical protein